MTTTDRVTSVDVEHVTKTFATAHGTTTAMTDVSLHIAPGELLSVVGPSGCGKSTLLRIIAGLEPPTEGQARVGGELVRGPSPRHGVVFQRPALFPWLDVMANVTFGPRMQGKQRRAAVVEQAERYIAAVGLTGFEHHKVYQLSGGMMHRVALARVLINRPDLLLMDEPFGALDAQTRLVMQELLIGIWQADRSTLLFITHDVEEALFLSDRVVVMTARPGQIKAEYLVDLPRPRDVSVLAAPRFAELKYQVLTSIREETQRTVTLEQTEALAADPP